MNSFSSQLIAADRRCRSWREKLDFVRGWLAENQPGIEQLVDTAIYLRFLSAGHIHCAEDGQHYRPAHHARIASDIQAHVARYAPPDAAWIARKILPSLPSPAREFRRAEPLTRIRDIAHRNDIPPELKKEIKTTLQNKLHRCAGPEDLVTSAALLERFTASGTNYPPAFVEQFKLFHEELKEFFNARSLDEQLTALLPGAGEETAGVIGDFLAAKQSLDNPAANASGHAGPDATASHSPEAAARNVRGLARTFQLLTTLRGQLLAASSESEPDRAHAFLLADIALEDFAFVLASDLINALETDGSDAKWQRLMDMLEEVSANLALSAIDADECRAIASEARAWRTGFNPSDREGLLRLKATADRARRLAGSFSDRLATLFVPRVETLGKELGVDGRAIRVFCEAEIRGHLVLQLSKVTALLSRRLRQALELPAWDVIVSGRATGRVRLLKRMEEAAEHSDDPVIALLEHAEGDEELPATVAGIVLSHELPHLSHLGVRARQAGVVLVACDDPPQFAALRQLGDGAFTLVALGDRFELLPAADFNGMRAGRQPVQIDLPDVDLAPKHACIPLELVSAKNSGGKADGARRLAELAARQGAGFRTPQSLVIPFGVMEHQLREPAGPGAPERGGAGDPGAAQVRHWIQRLDELPAAELDSALDRIQACVRQISIPGEIISAVESTFGRKGLMVRSSANCEDLERFAGAGLHDSIHNVRPGGVAAAIGAVWASLWTRRAVLGRKRADIPHERARMAVLIQEMLAPDLSFVLHTTNPINGNARELYAEIAVGLGETLVSGAVRGLPCRLVCDKSSGQVITLGLASFSHALAPGEDGNVVERRLDYSQVQLTCAPQFRQALGNRLASIGQLVEDAFGQAQDIEGAIIGDEIFLVQSRPQQI